MNSTMRIQITVDARQARSQITQLRGQLDGLSKVMQAHTSKMQSLQNSANKAQATADDLAARRSIAIKERQAKSEQTIQANQIRLNQNLAANELKNAEKLASLKIELEAKTAAKLEEYSLKTAEAQNKAGNNALANATRNAERLEAQKREANQKLEQMEALHQQKMENIQNSANQKIANDQARADQNLSALKDRQQASYAAQVTKLGLGLAAYKDKLAGIGGAASGAAGGGNIFSRAWSGITATLTAGVTALGKAGEGLRFVGRQATNIGRAITQTITVPVALLAKSGISMALDMDRAMTRLRRVYGELGMSQSQVSAESKELQRTFFALSNLFGIHAEEVAQIGAEWAQAGAKGTTLQAATRATIEAMKLGDLSAEQASKALITLMDTYSLTAKSIDANGNLIGNSLQDALATFNAIENETAINMDDLITGVTKAGAVAKNAGVDIRHLGAMMAALVPSTGDAAEAGNALKTVLLQVMAPAKEAKAAMRQLGIDVDGTAWRSKNATERLDALAKSAQGLDQSQKLEFSRSVANLRQSNKFLALLDDMVNANSQYQKALDVTANKTQVLALYNQELAQIMQSPSQRFAMFTNLLRNTLIQAILPLLPALNNLMAMISRLTNWFANLSPHTQHLIIYMILLAATFGPLLMYIGAVASGLGALASTIATVIGAIAGFVGISSGAVVAIAATAAAVGFLALLFKDKLASAVKGIGAFFEKAFSGLEPFIAQVMSGISRIVNAGLRFLPESFANAFRAVVQVVAGAAKAVYKLLSWMNPFARHSPSLVEQVQDGTAVIGDAYARVASSVSNSMSQVEAQVRRLGASIAAAKEAADAAQMSENIKFAVAAGADAGEVRALIDTVASLNVQLANLKNQVADQKNVTEAWKTELDNANDAVKAAEGELKNLEKVVSDLDKEISDSKNRLQGWLDAPIAGTYAFEDAIFSNEQAQKSLQLQIAQLTQSVMDAGFSVDTVRQYLKDQAAAAVTATDANDALNTSLANSALTADETKQRMAQLRTEIETLQGSSLDLRLQGAGSDVLGGLQWQIQQAEGQRQALANNLATGATSGGSTPGSGATPPANVAAAVAQIDELQKKLDSLQNQGQILDLQKALALEPAQKAIKDTQRVAEQSFDAIMNGIKTEMALTDELTAKRDAATAAVERQQAAVDSLTASRDAIQAVYDAESKKLDELQKQYDSLNDTIKFAQDQLDEAFKLGEDILKKKEAAANNPIGGAGDFAVPAGAGGLSNDPYNLGDMQAYTDGILKELQDQLGQFDPVGGIKRKFQDLKNWLSGIGSDIASAIDRMLAPASDKLSGFFDRVAGPLRAGWDRAWAFLKEDIFGPFNAHVLVNLENLYNNIKGKLGPLGEAFGNLWDAVRDKTQAFWDYFGPAIMTVLNIVLGFFLSTFIPQVQAIWELFTSIIGRAIDFVSEFLGGFITMITGVINVIAGLISGDWSLVWEGAKQIFQGIWEQILAILKFVLGVIWDVIRVGFTEVWNIIQNLWNTFGAPIFNAIWDWIDRNFIAKVKGIGSTIGDAFRVAIDTIGGFFSGLGGKIAGGVNAAIYVLNTFLTGINNIASKLGVGFRVGLIGYLGTSAPGTGAIGNNAMPMAAGGQIPTAMVGSGFVTNGARAIVGEGNPAYPEFVIPTDPQHRGRALSLLAQLAKQLGLASGGVVPQYALGGLLGSGLNVAAQTLWNTTVNTARNGLSGGGFAEQLGRGALEQLISGVLPKIGQWMTTWASSQITSLVGRVTGSLGMPLAGGGIIPHIYAMAEGAYVKGGRGGVLAHIGEGRKDEIVAPLDHYSRNDKGGNTYHFHGDLSFPNITSGNDAKKFLDNLEALG